MRVGYARVSSVGQSLAVQLARLAHCERIFQEKRSGTTDQRPALKESLGFVREGDTLVVTRLDRLARSMLHLCAIGEELARKKVELEVLDQAIETHSATGRLLFHLLGAFAEFETTLRRERQQEGIAHAQGRGVRFGRTHALSALQVDQLRQRRTHGEPIKVLMRAYALSKTSVYRYLDGTRPQTPTREAEAAD